MKNIISTLNFITISMYLTWGILPILQRNISSSVIIILISFWGLFNLIDVVHNKKNINRIYIIGVYIILFYLIQYLRVYPFIAIGNLFNQILFIFPVFMYYSLRNNKQKKILFNYIIILGVGVIITNIIILLEDPNASKFMTGSVDVAIERYGNSNVATVNHVTFITLLFPIFIYLYSKFKNKIYILIITGIIYFVYLAGASITLLTLILILIFLIYFKLRSTLERVIMVFSILTLVVVLFAIRDQIGDMFLKWANQITNALYSTRLIELSEVLKGKETQGSFATRLEDMKTSMISFIINPIFGKGLIYHNDISKTGIGMHSHIFDELARFGLSGLVLIIIYIRETYRNIFNNKNNMKVLNTVKIIILSLSFFALFNMIINPVYGILIFFMVPIFSELYNLNDDEHLSFNENKKIIK